MLSIEEVLRIGVWYVIVTVWLQKEIRWGIVAVWDFYGF